MDMGLVVAGAVVLVAMVAISVYGAVTLPPGSRVPLHHGFGGWNNWRSKTVALVAWPAIAAFAYAILLVVTSHASSNGKTAPAAIVPVVMLVLVFAYYGAIRAARRENGRG